jgi:hypothetical protein
MLISVYFNTTAPDSLRFKGTGNLVCVEFQKTASFKGNDTVSVNVVDMKESYITGVTPAIVGSNNYISYSQDTFKSALKFWIDNSPIGGRATDTKVYGNNNACTALSTTFTSVDTFGNFTHLLTNGLKLTIVRDYDNITSDVQPIVNGFDALQVRRVLIEDLTFTPSIYEILSMDVNLDGKISAGDASQINQRAVKRIGEYRQEWNYNDNGSPKPNYALSKDWMFIEESLVLTDPKYSVSAIYPRYDNIGYNKDNVPVPSFCNITPVSNYGRCAVIGTENYIGYILGDVNGNWANQPTNSSLRSNDNLKFDLGSAKVDGKQISIPVYFNSNNDVKAVDFSFIFNQDKLTYNSVSAKIENMAYFNEEDNTLRFTSNSLTTLNTNEPVAYVNFMTNGSINVDDFANINAYLNGEKVNAEVVSSLLNNEDVIDFSAIVYPNPASSELNISVNSVAKFELVDVTGKVMLKSNLEKGVNKLNVSNVASGLYVTKVYTNNGVKLSKVYIVD